MPVAALHGEGGSILGTHVQGLEGPFVNIFWIDSRFKQFGRLARRKGHVELVERNTQPFAACLDVGFFPGPAVKEAHRLRMQGEVAKLLHFSSRKEAFGYAVVRRFGADALDIDSYFAISRKDVQQKAMGVGQVEGDPFSFVGMKQGRFAKGVVKEFEIARRYSGIGTEKEAQESTPQDKFSAVIFKPIAPGFSLFVCR